MKRHGSHRNSRSFHHADQRGLGRLYHHRALAGWIAGMIMKTKEGLLLDIVIGVVGALIGGFLLSFFVHTASGGWWFTLFTAILGAVILLGLLRLVRRA
jgi:uncharacterized membrane protein YeaQ/YmgE (transglycosylase-associated protein family)